MASCIISLFFTMYYVHFPTYVGPCHHGMASPRLADGEQPPMLLRIYWTSSHGQQTRGSPPAWGLGKVLTTPHWNIWLCYETWTLASDLDWYIGTTWAGSG